MIEDGESWKCSAEAPTAADMMKYAATGAKLLVEFKWAMNPTEIYVVDVANNGEVFKYSSGYNPASVIMFGCASQWCRTSDVRVLAILPPPEPEPEPKRRKKK